MFRHTASALGALFCFAGSQFAGPISSTSVAFEARSNYNSNLCECPVYSGASSVNGAYHTTGLSGLGAFTGSGYATSGFGLLSGYATAVITDFAPGSNVGLSYLDSNGAVKSYWLNNPVGIMSSFTDTVSVNGSAAAYTLTFDLDLSGTVIASGEMVTPSSYVQVRVTGPNGFKASAFKPFTGTGLYQLAMPNVPGNVALTVIYTLSASATILDQVAVTDVKPTGATQNNAKIVSVVNNRTGPYSASITLDFAHTARFGNYEVTLPSGAAAPDVTLISENGFVYQNVPEPGSLVLIGFGLALTTLLKRQRH